MAFVRLLTSALALTGLASSAPASLDKRDGSVPALQGDRSLIDQNGEYVRVTRLQDGSLIAGYAQLPTADTNNEKVLVTARSIDNGATWSHLGEVFRGDPAAHDLDNAFVMQLDSGRILYAYRNHDLDPDNNAAQIYFRISISYSDDGGVTFKYLSTVDQRPHDPNGVDGLWEPYMRIAQDGSIQCYYSSENSAGDQDGHMRVSTDGGVTWGDIIIVSGDGVLSRDGMMGVAPIDNGPNLICVFENTEAGFFSVDAVISHDDGLTWGERHNVYTARDGTDCQDPPQRFTAGAPQVYNVWGTLVLGFMTNEDHDVCHGYDGGDMKVIVSTDGAQTWSQSYIMGPSPASWEGLFNLDPTHFLALYAADGVAYSQTVQLN